MSSPPPKHGCRIENTNRPPISDTLGRKEPCQQDVLFATEMRPENIIPIFNLYSRTSWHIKCAAIAAATTAMSCLAARI